MKPSRQWLIYSAIRVGIFAIALAVLLVLGVNPWISAVSAALIGFCVSYIFFRGQRDAVAKSIVSIRSGRTSDIDNDIENEALDRLEDGRAKPLDE